MTHEQVNPVSPAATSRPEQTLKSGTVLGKHTVIKFAGSDTFGEVYSVFFGTTNHIYRLHVLTADSMCTPEEAPNIVKRMSALQTPCVMKFFASGTTDGIFWIRSEYSPGVTAAYFKTALASKEEIESSPGDLPVYYTAGEFINAANGKMSPADRDILIADILDALSAMHKARLAFCGDFDSVAMVRKHQPKGFIAKIPSAVDAEENPERMESDVIAAAHFIERITEESECASKTSEKLKISILEFASDTYSGKSGFSNCAEMYDAFVSLLAKFGVRRKNRQLEEHASAPAAQTAAPQTDHRRRESREHSGHSGSHKHSRRGRSRERKNVRTINENVISAMKMILLIAVLIVIGTAVSLWMSYIDKQQPGTASTSYNSISIIGENVSSAQSLPDNVNYYSLEQLIAGAPRNPYAAARLAVLTYSGKNGVEKDPARAGALMASALSVIQGTRENTPDDNYWTTYAMLLGIHTLQDTQEAERRLASLASNGHYFAGLLLGDWLIAKSSGSNSENDRAAITYWHRIVDNPSAWRPVQTYAADRLAYYIHLGRGVPRDPQKLLSTFESLAGRGHHMSIMLLAELYLEGRIVEKNPATANMWLKRIYDDRTAPTAMRIKAAKTRAELFSEGVVSEPSPVAARIWYNNAANLGDPQAMLILSEYCENGIGNEHGIKMPQEAEYWKKKYEETIASGNKIGEIFVQPESLPLPASDSAKNTGKAEAPRESSAFSLITEEAGTSGSTGSTVRALKPLSD